MQPVLWNCAFSAIVLFVVAWGVLGAFFYHKGRHS